MLVDTLTDLISDLGLTEDYNNATLAALLEGESKYLKDLRMNVKGFLRSKELSKKEVYLVSLAVANDLNNECLQTSYTNKALEEGVTKAEVAEALACASLLSTNNVFYRFRHYMAKPSYEQMRAGLRMNIMMNPVLGKEFFELLSLAISAVNGCELCIKSHEASLLELGSKESRIFETIRLASVVTSLSKVIY